MVCTFEVVSAVTLTGRQRGQVLLLTHPSKEGGGATKPPDPSCTGARLDVRLFTTSCLHPHQKLQLPCLFIYANTHTHFNSTTFYFFR